MRRSISALFLVAFAAFSIDAQAISIPVVAVGNAGNANDTTTGNRFGGVPYNYKIATNDVTVGQYTAFLNAVAATDTYALFNPSMTTDLNIAGIARSGVSGSYTYSVIGSANYPVTYVGWGDAARFANWLDNGQPKGAEGAGTTETGAYTLNGAVTPATLSAVTRNAGTGWVIPSESEWYKAAYYNPATSSYYQYPFSSNDAPNFGNFFHFTFGYYVTHSMSYSTSQNYLTDVGTFATSVSPYGLFDMGGEVYQWNEAVIGASRGSRGGAWDFDSSFIPSSSRRTGNFGESSDIGFRVASVVPEPSSLVLAALGFVALAAWRLRRR
jgi:formylglycine-generating enzyme